MADSSMRVKLGEHGLLGAAADVMHDLTFGISCERGCRGLAECCHDDADVRQARIEQPCDDVAGFKRPGEAVARCGNSGAPLAGSAALEECFEIKHAAVIDIGIRPLRSPGTACGIGVKVLQHVFVDKLLKIETERIACSANHNVSADAGGSRHVTVGVADRRPGWIVTCGDADLSSRCCGEFFASAR